MNEAEDMGDESLAITANSYLDRHWSERKLRLRTRRRL